MLVKLISNDYGLYLLPKGAMIDKLFTKDKLGDCKDILVQRSEVLSCNESIKSLDKLWDNEVYKEGDRVTCVFKHYATHIENDVVYGLNFTVEYTIENDTLDINHIVTSDKAINLNFIETCMAELCLQESFLLKKLEFKNNNNSNFLNDNDYVHRLDRTEPYKHCVKYYLNKTL